MSAYKCCFWTITGVTNNSGVYSAENRQRMADAVSEVYTTDTDLIFSSFAGGVDNREAPEIMLTVPFTDQSVFVTRVGSLQDDIQLALSDTFAGTSDANTVGVTRQDAVRYQLFDDSQLATLESLRSAFTLEKARATHEAVAKLKISPLPSPLPSHFHRLKSSTSDISATNAGDIPADQVVEGFTVTSARYEFLKKAEGSDIQKAIEGIQKTFDNISKETKTNVAALLMVAGGIVTVGKLMWEAYGALTAVAAMDLAEVVSGLLAAVGGIAGIAAIVVAVVALVGILWALLKNAENIMVLVNGQKSVVTLTQDIMLHGERRTVTLDLPAAPDDDGIKPVVYPAGFFAYQKAEVAGVPLSFYGSTVGIAYSVGSDAFSIGLDCPDTILGGTNSVAALSGNQALNAANRADTGGSATETVPNTNGGSVQVTRASGWGSTNYIAALVLPA